ncbi:MED14 [Mytilus edulis]|uniref:MED14 n=1 Tax=Mytilus edulis TaxID=6550 RepID=A0A8S3QDG6_MYTED|nr:MED14 [Mytilus edulis]
MSNKICRFILNKIDDTLIIPKKISNLTGKVKKYLESGGDKLATLKDLQKDPGLELPLIFPKYGITTECLVDKNILPIDHPLSLSVQDVLFLRRLLHYKNLPWTHAEYWVDTLLHTSVSAKSVRLQWNNIHQKFHHYRTSGSPGAGDDLSTFMSDQYHHPTTHGKSTKPNLKTVVISQQQKMRKMRVELVQTYASLINATDEVEQLTLNNATLEGPDGRLSETEK